MAMEKSVRFYTSWNNVWVKYLKKYFKNAQVIVQDKFNKTDVETPCDVAVFCWANELPIYLTRKNIKFAKKYVVFVRSYEIFFEYIYEMNWKLVDDVILVNKVFFDCYRGMFEKNGCKVHYLPNAIDLDEWQMQEHMIGPKIAMVCRLNHKKGLDLIPQFMSMIPKEYHLHIAGKIQGIRHVAYIDNIIYHMGLKDRVHYEGEVKDVKGWLKDKNYLFTCSVTEGHPNNVIEAMALGIKPLIHGWIGAECHFPEGLIWYKLEDAVKMIKEGKYESHLYRKWVEERWDMNKIYPQLEKIIARKGQSQKHMPKDKASVQTSPPKKRRRGRPRKHKNNLHNG